MIAIIDDDSSVRLAIENLVECYGFVVKSYCSGEEFLSLSDLNEISCVVSDIHMSGMSGIDVQEHLRRLKYTTPFIFISAYSDIGTRHRAMMGGAAAFLLKPFSGGELIESINRALL